MPYNPPVFNDIYPSNMSSWELELPTFDSYCLSSWNIPRYTSYSDTARGDALNRFVGQCFCETTSDMLSVYNTRAGFCAFHRFKIICELRGLSRLRKSRTKDILIAYNERMLTITDMAFPLYSRDRESLRHSFFSERVIKKGDLYSWFNALINAEERLSHPPECRHEIRTEMSAIEFHSSAAFTEFREMIIQESRRLDRQSAVPEERPKRKFRINHVRVAEPNNLYGTIAESFSIGNSAKIKVNRVDTIDAGENMIVRTEFVLPREDYEIEHRFSTRVISVNQPDTGSNSTVLQPDSNTSEQHSRVIDI